MTIFAQASGTPGLVTFIQYGALGLVVIGFVIGWIWPKPSVDRLLRDIARLETQVDELTSTYQRDVIPTMVRASETLVKVHRRMDRTDGEV